MSRQPDRKRDQKERVAGPSAQEVERLIQKGWLKDAVKQAKLVYRDATTPENHCLLERAYFLRAEELHRASMPTSAAEVAQHLLDFGVTDPALPAKLAPLLLAVGLSQAALALGERLGSPEDQAQLMRTAADQAVLHPDRISNAASFAELREGASLVRGALSALDAGDEAGALERLQPIARSSPFADWRYFVRGLAAHRRRDPEQVDAHWNRLDPGRAAAHIVRTLHSLTDGAGVPAPTAATPSKVTTATRDLSTLETAVFGEPLLAPLERLRQAVAANRWDDVIPLLPALRFGLRRVDPRLAERLTRTLVLPLANELEDCAPREARQLIGSFTKAAEPLPIDPHWNRLRALLAEGPQADSKDAERFWQAYVADLATLPNLTPEQRQRAQALVWEHQALLLADMIDEVSAGFPGPKVSQQRLAKLQSQVLKYLDESRRHDPTYLGAPKSLVDLLDDWDRDEEATAAAVKLLEQFPNHDETLRWLAERYLESDDPEQALPLIQRVRALKPLDEALRSLEWNAHGALARRHALKRRWDKGRVELALAEALLPELSKQYFFAARRAVFELKAGQPEAAERWIEAGQQALVEPTPLWLSILVEGTRYRLPKPALARFKRLWEAGIAAKVKSETAGKLAQLLAGYLASGVKYTGRSSHVQQLIRYLKRGLRIPYQCDDLIGVCIFLSGQPREMGLLDKLVDRGLKAFPESAHFHFLAGVLEVKAGPFLADLPYAQQELRKALELAQASNEPRETQLVPEIKAALSKVDSILSYIGMPFGGFQPPFPGGGMPGFSGTPDDLDWGFDDWDYDDEEEYDEDWDDEPAPPTRRGARPKTPPGTSKGQNRGKSQAKGQPKKKK